MYAHQLPSKQNLVKEELQQVFGDSKRSCTMEDAAQLKYLESCIKEAQRLFPSVPVLERTIDEDIELDGYTLLAGTSIAIQIYALHRHPEYFPDPLVFKPERFHSPSDEVPRHPYAYIPFSAGPRNCIGQRFAILEEKVILSSLLRQFRFSYDEAKYGPPIPIPDLTMKPFSVLKLRITADPMY